MVLAGLLLLRADALHAAHGGRPRHLTLILTLTLTPNPSPNPEPEPEPEPESPNLTPNPSLTRALTRTRSPNQVAQGTVLDQSEIIQELFHYLEALTLTMYA